MKTRISIDEDLYLAILQPLDVQDIFNTIINEKEYLGRWLPFVASTHEFKDTENFVTQAIHVATQIPQYVFTIRYQEQFAGLLGMTSTDVQNQKTELGYWLAEAYQKKGIMTKSITELCRWIFTELPINRIQIKCAVHNSPSQKIPLVLNFHLEGVERDGELLTKDVFTDLNIYSLLKKDWINQTMK
jgi:ribosomal-protein-serine acetyltransferase